TEAEQLKIVLKRSRQETHISQQSGSGTGEGTGSKPGVPDVPSDDSEEELSWKSSDYEEVGSHEEGKESNDDSKGGNEVRKSGCESKEEEETSEEEEVSFNPIPKTTEDSEKESDDEEEQESRFSEEARIQKEKDAEELYRDVNINQGWGLQVTQSVEDTQVILTPINPDDPQESSSMSSFVSSMLNPLSDVGVESIFTTTPSQTVSLE
nr:hypothetical protein [Tanacetum cinerariifolium]